MSTQIDDNDGNDDSRNILGSQETADWTVWKGKTRTSISTPDTTPKRKMKFCGWRVTTDENRLIFQYLVGLEATMKWMEEVKRVAEEVRTSPSFTH